jgi:hypothetical protein
MSGAKQADATVWNIEKISQNNVYQYAIIRPEGVFCSARAGNLESSAYSLDFGGG